MKFRQRGIFQYPDNPRQSRDQFPSHLSIRITTRSCQAKLQSKLGPVSAGTRPGPASAQAEPNSLNFANLTHPAEKTVKLQLFCNLDQLY